MLAAAVIGALVLVAVVLWARGRRQSPPHSGHADSDLRDAFVGLLMTVGPFFGVRHTPPRVEIPVVMAPAGEELDPAAREVPSEGFEELDRGHHEGQVQRSVGDKNGHVEESGTR